MPGPLQGLLQVLSLLGVPQLLLYLQRPCVRILMYHGVSESWPPEAPFHGRGKQVPRELFQRHMAWLQRWMNPLSVEELVHLLESGEPLPARGVVVTLDDGYRNNLLQAAPVLAAVGIPAIVYVTSDLVEQRCLWVDRLDAVLEGLPRGQVQVPGEEEPGPVLNWSNTGEARQVASKLRALGKTVVGEVREKLMSAVVAPPGRDLEALPPAERPADVRGLDRDELSRLEKSGVEIGGHTLSHQVLSRCDDQLLQRELRESRRLLENWCEGSVEHFAYPNGGVGDYDERTEQAVRDAGYRSAMTTVRGVVRAGDRPLELKRIPINGDEQFAFFLADVSGLRDLLLVLRGFIRRLRRPEDSRTQR